MSAKCKIHLEEKEMGDGGTLDVCYEVPGGGCELLLGNDEAESGLGVITVHAFELLLGLHRQLKIDSPNTSEGVYTMEQTRSELERLVVVDKS